MMRPASATISTRISVWMRPILSESIPETNLPDVLAIEITDTLRAAKAALAPTCSWAMAEMFERSMRPIIADDVKSRKRG